MHALRHNCHPRIPDLVNKTGQREQRVRRLWAKLTVLQLEVSSVLGNIVFRDQVSLTSEMISTVFSGSDKRRPFLLKLCWGLAAL